MQNDPAQAIIAQEKHALDRWSAGHPLGYIDVDADDVTYYDDIGAHRRVDGIQAMREYFNALEGQIPPHDYEMADPKVQLYDGIGILTFRYAPSADGQALQPWKATSVYRRDEGEWRIVHAHWSMVKEA